MDEIIDLPEVESVYLKKSARLCKIYGGLILLSILVSVFIKPLFYKEYVRYNDLIDLFIGLPILAMFVIAPLGLYYSWKSYKRKEGQRMIRFKYTFGHLLVCILLMLITGVLLADLSRLLN